MICADAVDSIPTLLFAWIGSGWITVLLPLTLFIGSRLSHSFKAWERQEEQDAYNQYDQADAYYDQEDSRPWWDFNWGRTAWSQGGENHGLVVAYTISLLLFVGLIYAGIRSVKRTHSLVGLQRPLILMACYGAVSLLVLANTSNIVATEGRVVEEHGFVGQVGVMMYLTNILWIAFALSFIHVNRGYIRRQQQQEKFLEDGEKEQDVDDDVVMVNA